MKKIAFIMLFGLLIAFSLSLSGCSGGSGGGNSGTPANASEVPNQVASAQVPVTGETTITVSDPNSPIAGAKVVIPKDAAIDPINVVIGYEDNPPAPLNANALSMGAVQVSKVIIPHVTGGGPSTFNHLTEITIPYDKTKAKGLPPVVVYWDEKNKIYRPVAVVKIDRDKGLVTFKVPHFSRFMAVIVEKLGLSLPDVDTGFRMGIDSILHPNFGSYEFGGHCAAFASISSHYFSMKKAKKLYTFAQDGVIEQPLDDELVRSALTYTYALLASKISDVVSQVYIPSKTDTGILVLEAMIITGQPIHFSMRNSSGDFWHSVVVYGYDSANARFRIYDNNYPKDEVTFDWNILTGFGSYSKASGYKYFSTDYIGYYSDDTFGESSQFEKIISDWESDKLKDYFANLSVNDEYSSARKLGFGSDVKVMVSSSNPVVLTGHFTVPTGNQNKANYLYVFQNGKQLSVTTIPSSGDFSFNVNGNISTNTEIVLMVSGHERDLFSGFAAYGKFTITPAPPTDGIVSGLWHGDWNHKTQIGAIGVIDKSGEIFTSLTQAGTSISGSGTNGGLTCVCFNYLSVLANVSGSISGNSVTMSLAFQGDIRFDFNGTVNNNIINGNYSIFGGPCNGDTGTGTFNKLTAPSTFPSGLILVAPNTTLTLEVAGGIPPYIITSDDAKNAYDSAPGDGSWTVMQNFGTFTVHIGAGGITGNGTNTTVHITVTDANGTQATTKTMFAIANF